MGGLIPLSNASRRPVRMPVVTPLIILVNVLRFGEELVEQNPTWASLEKSRELMLSSVRQTPNEGYSFVESA
jgi:hypothetical protein